MDEIQKVLIKEGRKDLAQEYYKKVAATKPLIFTQSKAFKDAVKKLEKEMKEIKLLTIDKDKETIKFDSDYARRRVFEVLGKDDIKMFTKWKGPSIWE